MDGLNNHIKHIALLGVCVRVICIKRRKEVDGTYSSRSYSAIHHRIMKGALPAYLSLHPSAYDDRRMRNSKLTPQLHKGLIIEGENFE